jgi:Zn-dependent protease with chaperone function
MTFFQNQIQARAKTKTLVLLFAVALLLMLAVIYTGLRILIFKYTSGMADKSWFPADFFDPLQIIAICAPVATVVLIASLVKMYQLTSGGGKQIAEAMGGRLIQPNTTDTDERRLFNIVEEMAIASGLAVPWIYVIDADRSINAFTAGIRPSEFVITVSRGAMRLLNRDELQAVIAHEFSHIFNGDVRLNIRLMGLLFGILFVGMTGEQILKLGLQSSRQSRRRSKDGPVMPLIALGSLLAIVGYVGVFFAKIIQFAVSRQREFLADASAVQFTRLKSGITGALKKIGGLTEGSKISSPHAQLASHLFFADAITRNYFSLFTTHPPILERIKRIEPEFAGIYQRIQYSSEELLNPDSQEQTRNIYSSQPLAQEQPKAKETQDSELGRVKKVIDLVGTLSAANLAAAQNLVSGQSDIIKALVHDPLGARALTYLCLLESNDVIRAQQLAVIRNYENRGVITALNQLIWHKTELKSQRLSTIELCFPALRQMSRQQFLSFREIISRLIKVDDHVSIWEYALYRLLCDHLARHFDIERALGQTQLTPETGLYTTTSMLLAQLAVLTNSNRFEAFSAYTEGARVFGVGTREVFNLENFPMPSLNDFDLCFSLIDTIPLSWRQKMLEACTTIALFNQHVSSDEYDLVRIIAAKLDCPLPILGKTTMI